jgi:hypothetical protein
MTNVLMIGLKAEAVDLSDPRLPPGTTHAMIDHAIDAAIEAMRARGWRAEHCAILADDSAEATIASSLADGPWDCIVIGAGVRVPAENLFLLERVLNAVRLGAPDTPVAFNVRLDDSAAAAQRWLPAGA